MSPNGSPTYIAARTLWAETKLSCVMMDILMETDMSWDAMGGVKNRAYTLEILASLVLDGSIGTIIIGCKRVRCSDTSLDSQLAFISIMLDALWRLMLVPGDGLKERVAGDAAKYNFISVISWFVVRIVEHGRIDFVDTLESLMTSLTAPLQRLKRETDGNHTEFTSRLRATAYHTTGRRVWLDTLKALTTTVPPPRRRKLKPDVIRLWRHYGSTIGLGEDGAVAAVSLKGPSDPDWEAGHKDVCKL
ncbi:hypothetical protein EIP91_001738 [Steccherinum ochraceum]|uniref:Uncharacterized protein n=1 Tax=Steccherinum ochraceum TaxID=92696 RepID=A0A4R0RLW1_9APHY|nr:hypothetical protein EIP91_001738 [Steccherinum ochraceum]